VPDGRCFLVNGKKTARQEYYDVSTPINIVLYGKPYTAHVSDELIFNGKSLNQYSHTGEYGDGFSLISTDVYLAILKSLVRGTHGNKEKAAVNLVDRLREDFANYKLITGTRVYFENSLFSSQLQVEHDKYLPPSRRVVRPNRVSTLRCGLLGESCYSDNRWFPFVGMPYREAASLLEEFSGLRPHLFTERHSRYTNISGDRSVMIGGWPQLVIDATWNHKGRARGVIVEPRVQK
jgi:hypothetical protein